MSNKTAQAPTDPFSSPVWGARENVNNGLNGKVQCEKRVPIMRKRTIIAILALGIIAGGVPAFFTANRLIKYEATANTSYHQSWRLNLS